MLIEQIIECQLKGPGPLAVHVLLQLVNFMTKQKSWRKIFESITIYCKNIAGCNVPYLPLHGPNHLQLKFYTTMQNFKRVLDWIASKRRIEQLNYFSIGFQMLKI